jgi:hypothetical protein
MAVRKQPMRFSIAAWSIILPKSGPTLGMTSGCTLPLAAALTSSAMAARADSSDS